jgi:hypothetical protein
MRASSRNPSSWKSVVVDAPHLGQHSLERDRAFEAALADGGGFEDLGHAAASQAPPQPIAGAHQQKGNMGEACARSC